MASRTNRPAALTAARRSRPRARLAASAAENVQPLPLTLSVAIRVFRTIQASPYAVITASSGSPSKAPPVTTTASAPSLRKV